MAKKKSLIQELIEERDKPRTKLTHKEFSQWRFSIYEMQRAEVNLNVSMLEYKLMQKDMEIIALKGQLFLKTKVGESKEKSDQSKVEYERIKSELEKELGYTLSGKSIDEITLEIRDLQE